MENLVSTHFVAIEEALQSAHEDIASVALVVGASAAYLGSPLQEVLDQLERTYAEHGALPAYDVVRAITVAWTEAAMIHHHEVSCEDPLTMLSTTAHLRARLGDLYRGAERDGIKVSEFHALVVVDLPLTSSPNQLSGSLTMLEAAEAMRTVYSGEETIAQVTPRRIVALVERARTDKATLGLLQILVRRLQAGDAEPRLWLEALPRHAVGIGWLLTELAR
ncbi:MAG: hypothetical protein ABIR57_05400 [Aeromicrobium sp.]